jgi:prepilin-type N-terminal cleavage/methylation domain-containing protein
MMRQRLLRNDGFTLIEVMVAALILVLGATALAVVLINGQAQASGDVQESQLISAADAKIEQIRAGVQAGGFNALALATAPTAAGNAAGTIRLTWANPNSFVQNSSGCGPSNEYFEIESNYDGGTTANPPTDFMQWQNCGTDGEPLEVLSGGSVTSGSGGACSETYLTNCTVTIGSSTATVYTFVTDTYIPCDTTNTNNVCPSLNAAGTQITGCVASANFPTTTGASTLCADARRVTVVLVPTATTPAAGAKSLQRITPVYLSAVFTSATPNSGSTTPAGITVGVGL